MKIKRYCHNGHLVRKETDKELKKEYPYYCPICDENMYDFETALSKDRAQRFAEDKRGSW